MYVSCIYLAIQCWAKDKCLYGNLLSKLYVYDSQTAFQQSQPSTLIPSWQQTAKGSFSNWQYIAALHCGGYQATLQGRKETTISIFGTQAGCQTSSTTAQQYTGRCGSTKVDRLGEPKLRKLCFNQFIEFIIPVQTNLKVHNGMGTHQVHRPICFSLP